MYSARIYHSRHLVVLHSETFPSLVAATTWGLRMADITGQPVWILDTATGSVVTHCPANRAR